MEKIKKNGFSTIEFMIGAVLMTFVIFFPIAAQMEMHMIHTMEQELNRTLQMAAVEGMVTPEIVQATLQSFEKDGIPNAAFTSGTTLNPVNRGEIIHIGISAERPSQSLYSSVMSLIGGDDIESETFVVEGTIMSERLK